jgi:hypothetical protein
MAEPTSATLTATTGVDGRPLHPSRRRPLKVHFNPEKLELTISNAMEQNRNRRRREPPQLVTESTAKLSLELLFDTTDSGSDVRGLTFQVAQMMQPRPGPRQGGEARGVPSIVLFEWGSFVFEGYIDSYKETLDFFAPEGVPLRSTLSLSLTEQGRPFPAPQPLRGEDGREVVPTRPDAGVDGFARDLGVSRQAAQAIARDNGIENPRASGVDQLAVPRAGAPRPPRPLASPPTPAIAGGALAAFGQLRAPPELRIETPRLDLGEAFGAGATGSLDLRAGIAIGGTASAGSGLGASAGAAGGLGAGGGIVADVGASASAAIIIEEA